jgi:hypothetical protein
MAALAPLEREVVAMLLAGDHPALPALRTQLANAVVSDRKLDYASEVLLDVDRSIPDAELEGRFILAGVHATVAGLTRVVAFSLHIQGGRLRGLDAITFDEPWPKSWPYVANYRLTYAERPDLLDKYA